MLKNKSIDKGTILKFCQASFQVKYASQGGPYGIVYLAQPVYLQLSAKTHSYLLY